MEVGVYGLGRFGTLWASLLSNKFEVVAYNRTPKETAPANVRLVEFEELCKCRTIFLCVAISAIPSVAERLRASLAPGTLIMDTCSVKVLPLRQLCEILPPSISVLGTHPMFGPDSARSGIKGLPIIITSARSSEETRAQWAAAFEELGLAVHLMTADEHDREAAFTQGITHFIGRVLKDLNLLPSPIATLGYRRLLEVMEQTCNDPWQLFMDLQNLNPHTSEMRRALQESLKRIMAHFPDTRTDHGEGDHGKGDSTRDTHPR